MSFMDKLQKWLLTIFISDGTIDGKGPQEIVQQEISNQKIIIEKMIERMDPGERDKWLRHLYKIYYERFHSDNQIYWSTGKIFLPISLAAFGIYYQLQCNKFFPVLVLGLASCALTIFWWIICENHRAFQEKSMSFLEAIEAVIGLGYRGDPKLPIDKINKLVSEELKTLKVLRHITFFVVIVWFLIFIYHIFIHP